MNPGLSGHLGEEANLAVQALQICVISMAELVKIMKLVFPILMRFMASGEPLWASFFRHRKYRYV